MSGIISQEYALEWNENISDAAGNYDAFEKPFHETTL